MKAPIVGLSLMLSACAHIDFGNEGLTYYDPKPFLLVSTTKECVTTATVVVVPGQKRTLRFVSGYGSVDLSATLANGMIVSVGQKTDTKIPETITAIAALEKARVKADAADTQAGCEPTATLYPVVDGAPVTAGSIPFPVHRIR